MLIHSSADRVILGWGNNSLPSAFSLLSFVQAVIKSKERAKIDKLNFFIIFNFKLGDYFPDNVFGEKTLCRKWNLIYYT